MKQLKLKVALLSACLLSASLNAITANIPEMAQTFSNVPLYIVELLTTIPSLFQIAGVLGGRLLAKQIGYKKTLLFGILLCVISGLVPVFIQEFTLIMIMRVLFGIGAGLMVSVQLTLIISFFEGKERSTMIGLNGGISGLGSAATAFLAGRLLHLGWHMSFMVYAIGLLPFVLYLFLVPNVNAGTSEKEVSIENTEKPAFIRLIGLAGLMFASVLFATMYVIKASTLITEYGFGTAREGSLAITLLSLGSLTAGLTYGKIRSRLGEASLPLFFAICVLGFLAGGFARSLAPVWIGAFLLGYGYLGFMPFIQEQASTVFHAYGETATNLVLVMQSLGAFAAPYLGNLLGLITSSTQGQFLLTAVGFGLLILISLCGLLPSRFVARQSLT